MGGFLDERQVTLLEMAYQRDAKAIGEVGIVW